MHDNAHIDRRKQRGRRFRALPLWEQASLLAFVVGGAALGYLFFAEFAPGQPRGFTLYSRDANFIDFFFAILLGLPIGAFLGGGMWIWYCASRNRKGP